MHPIFITVGVLFWIYVGHYLIITLLAKNKKIEYKNNEKKPEITIIIPINKKTNFLNKKIRNTLKLKYPTNKLQILVVDSKNGHNKLLCSNFPAISYIQRTKDNLNNALNCALKKAKGEIVVKTDHDCFLESDVLEKLIKYFEIKNIGIVAGTEEVIQYPMKIYRDIVNSIRIKESLIDSTWAGGSFYAFRKNIVKKIPETKLISDDTFLSFEAVKKGYRAISVADIKVKEDISKDLIVTFKKFRRYFTQGIYTTLYQKNTLSKNPFFALVTIKNFLHLTLGPLLMYLILIYAITHLNINLLITLTGLTSLLCIFNKNIRNLAILFVMFLTIWPIAILYAIFKIEKW